jgi:hypothetical protein
MMFFMLAFSVFALGIILLFAWMLAVGWAFGMPIEIKKNNKVIGHIRWFTFTKVE